MNRFAAAVPLLLALAACDGGEQPSSAQPAAPARVLSDVERAALVASLPPPYDQADLENGRRAFARCRACHTVAEGGADMTGPNLHGVFGREAGDRPRYNYSNAMRQADFVWDAPTLDHWLLNPRTFLPGNKMSFPGLPDAADRRDVIAFLKVETGYQPQPTSPPAPAS